MCLHARRVVESLFLTRVGDKLEFNNFHSGSSLSMHSWDIKFNLIKASLLVGRFLYIDRAMYNALIQLKIGF